MRPPGRGTDALIHRRRSGPHLPALIHWVLDYPLAAVLIAGPLGLSFDRAATVIVVSEILRI
jgi:hypothetical protein